MTPSAIPISDPDISANELRAVSAALEHPRLSSGPIVQEFEAEFANYLGRKHAVAVASGTIGLLLVLKAYGLQPNEEVIASPYSWRETAHAISLAGLRPVFTDIDYWSGTIAAEKLEKRITSRTRAVLAGNTNGHPAPWEPLRTLCQKHNLLLFEDSTEAIGSAYRNAPVGTFGDSSVFDFSQPSAITCGEGGVIVTDDDEIADKIRHLREHRVDERSSVVVGDFPPMCANMSELTAALALAQLRRLDAILAARKEIERLYFKYVKSFEGIKDPYTAPEVTAIHWMLYLVHLGTRFTRSSRDAIVDDLRTERIEAAPFSQPLHVQPYYTRLGYRRGDLPVTEKVADRAVALPFHRHLTEEQIAFIVSTMKDASINVGAGSAIYL